MVNLNGDRPGPIASGQQVGPPGSPAVVPLHKAGIARRPGVLLGEPGLIAIFESILPIFLLIVAGMLLRRLPLIDERAWPGLEQLGYWFLYPALLFTTILRADFSGLELDAMMLALATALAFMIGLTLLLWPVLGRAGIVPESEYSSFFQTTVRWNGFMALAVAEKIFPPEGAAVVALVMAVIIAPLNVASVAVVSRFAERAASWPAVGRAVVTNPLIVAVIAAVLIRQMPVPLYGPVTETLHLIGRASIGMGLIAIGAGLRPGQMFSPRVSIWLSVVLKLLLFPAVVVATALSFGVGPQQVGYLALCGAVPTAMNGYLLARQLGGDAELYAAITTLQTALSFLTLPAALYATAYVTAG